MQITTKDLQRGLGLVQGAAERKMTIPILSNVLFQAANGKLILTATDLDTTIQATVPMTGDSFALCLPSRKLFDIVRLLNGDTVEIDRADNDRAIVKCGKARFTIAGSPVAQFPELGLPDQTKRILLDGAVFAKAVRRVRHAITTDAGRFTLAGAKLELSDSKGRLVTTDGHRLALAEFGAPDVELDVVADILIPRKALLEAARLFDGQSVAFGYDTNCLAFYGTDIVLSARKMTGTFPNYEQIFPKSAGCQTVFPVADAVAVLKRSAVLADEKANRADLSVFKDSIEVTVRDGEGNEAREAFPAKSEGSGVANDAQINVSFNVSYLIDALTFADAETVTANFDNGASPWVFTVPDGEWKSVVMPQRF